MGPTKTLAAAILALTATPFAVGQFARDVPEAVPSVLGWERIAGDLELSNPRAAVRYEFFVNPARPVIYEVVRYRVTPLGSGARGEGPGPVSEKLQWDRDGRDLRRFECVGGAGADAACSWQEMEKGGADYLGEVPMLLQLYMEHNRKSR